MELIITILDPTRAETVVLNTTPMWYHWSKKERCTADPIYQSMKNRDAPKASVDKTAIKMQFF